MFACDGNHRQHPKTECSSSSSSATATAGPRGEPPSYHRGAFCQASVSDFRAFPAPILYACAYDERKGAGQPGSSGAAPGVTRIKKPLNSFMIFARENRRAVTAQTGSRCASSVNQMLGLMWHRLREEERWHYHELAKKESERHKELYPSWKGSIRPGKRKKKVADEIGPGSGSGRKCRALYGLDNIRLWCAGCRRRKRCIMGTPVLLAEDFRFQGWSGCGQNTIPVFGPCDQSGGSFRSEFPRRRANSMNPPAAVPFGDRFCRADAGCPVESAVSFPSCHATSGADRTFQSFTYKDSTWSSNAGVVPFSNDFGGWSRNPLAVLNSNLQAGPAPCSRAADLLTSNRCLLRVAGDFSCDPGTECSGWQVGATGVCFPRPGSRPDDPMWNPSPSDDLSDRFRLLL